MSIFLVVVCLLFSTSSESQKVPAIYLFGDSLLDVGNNNYLKLSIFKANFPHYGIDYPGEIPTGRFCNRENTADRLAQKLGIVTSPPYLSLKSKSFPISGVSFASGRAGILNVTEERSKQCLTLSKQVEYYKKVYQAMVQNLGSAGALAHMSKSLFIVCIGTNDLADYLNPGSNVAKKTTPQAYVNSMAFTLKDVLKEIYNNGARKFAVFGVPGVGCCPAYRYYSKTDECSEKLNDYADRYNQALNSMLEELKSELEDMLYSYIDSYHIFNRFVQNPATYGLAEVKAACCGYGKLRARRGCGPFSPYCSNRSDHLFWDAYHPTEAAARKFVDTVFDGAQSYTFPRINQLIAA